LFCNFYTIAASPDGRDLIDIGGKLVCHGVNEILKNWQRYPWFRVFEKWCFNITVCPFFMLFNLPKKSEISGKINLSTLEQTNCKSKKKQLYLVFSCY